MNPSLPLVLIILACACGETAFARAQTEQHADLLGVYQAASLNDAQLSAARHDYNAQREAVPQARSGLLPNL
ncbi:Outer membrane efflux protein, partial [Pseudomonas syringae pv. primulae]